MFKKNAVTLIIGLLAFTFSFSQNDISFSGKLKEIDEQVDLRDYDRAKALLKEVRPNGDGLGIKEKYALDLRIAKVKYFADHDDSFIDRILVNLDEIDKMAPTDLQYDYLTFIGQVFPL